MSQYEKILLSILSGTKDKNVLFTDLRLVLDRLGFQCRIRGDHFIYTKDGVEEIINIQPVGNKAKPYQVKQIRNIILRYQLGGAINGEV
jgi:virulence-associated protein VapD